MSGKKTNKSKIRNTLIVIGVIAVAALAAYILLFMPMNNVPSWISNIRDAFYASAFYSDFENNFITDNRYTYLLKGLGVTFEVTFFAVLLGIVLGVIVALVRSSYDTLKEELKGGFGKAVLYFFYKLCGIYLTVIRGTPVVVQLMIIYFVIFASSNNKVMVAVLAFGINSGAYVAEIIRGGIMSIDKGQFEAGRSLGFGYVRTMAFIIIPQAFKTVLPALANEFIVLIKETSVSGYVGLQELTKGGDIIRSRTYSAFMPLIAVAIIYLVIVMFFSWLVSLLERRLKNSER
jgi:polar amino acid transport system permease protein/polar amino acid transport system substrate-binding protein